MPFADSRRLTGSNLFFATTGAVLEVVAAPLDDLLLDAWRERVESAGRKLGWQDRRSCARRHAGGASLAITAPCDQLFLATEVNEWALCAALAARDPSLLRSLQDTLVTAALAAAADSGHFLPPVLDEAAAHARFKRLADSEARPTLRALCAAATTQGLAWVLDDAELTLGAGLGGRSFPIGALPTVEGAPWQALRNIPTAIVTGSNGKTTTVRLLAACAQAHGWRTGYSCTDGVFIDGHEVATGDYSGPAGTRMVLREQRVAAAILETARGGILRRGIAVTRTDVAIVTNISSDHFGEYGIDDLAALADVKLSVAALVEPDGLLVLNANDAHLVAKVSGLSQRFGFCPPLGWFALDADLPALRAYRAHGVATCGVRDGRLCLSVGGVEHQLGLIAAMPLSVGGVATYNIANLAGAALAAAALGIAPATIARVCERFGSSPLDNPGRMMRFDAGGVKILVDYAHNPDGLRGLLTVAAHLRRGTGRLGMLLGHAGNRQDADIEELALVAAEFRPDLVVIKEIETHLRGRTPGELPKLIRAALLRSGIAEPALRVCGSEVAAAHCALAWARPGDVLALLVHSSDARAAVLKMLKEH